MTTDLRFGLTPTERQAIATDTHEGRVPRWWHPWGAEMTPNQASPDALHVSGCGASLMLVRGIKETANQIHLSYEIRFGSSRTSHVTLVRVYPREIIEEMFLAEQPPGLRNMFGAFPCTSFRPNYYICFGRYLNLPWPSTEDEHDPNLSIYVSDGFQRAVTLFLAAGG